MKTQKVLRMAALAVMAVLPALILQGCGKDCGEEARLGDFEYSQGNLPNAARHYERALLVDSACGNGLVRRKLTEVRARL